MKHYRQTTGFTCDPACLLMAMHALNKKIPMNKNSEMKVWEEANLITVPGCLPQGLALSAARRGFASEIIGQTTYVHETVGNDRISIRVSKRQLRACTKAGVKITDKMPHLADIKKALREKSIPLVLVSAKKIHGIDSPHWICVSDITKRYVYFHDPLLAKEIRLTKNDFVEMFRMVTVFLHKRMLILKQMR